jgi:hypothetical protein
MTPGRWSGKDPALINGEYATKNLTPRQHYFSNDKSVQK